MNPTLTLEGRMGGDPELKFIPSGKAVCSFSMVTSDRKKNESTDQWEDVDTTWWRVTAWEQMAENVAESLGKGDLVIVVGKASQRGYKDKDGNDRTAYQEIKAFSIGPSLKYATAKPNKGERGSTPAAAPSDDPWGSAPPADNDAPPF